MGDHTNEPKSGLQPLTVTGDGGPTRAETDQAMRRLAHAQAGGQFLRPRLVHITPEMATKLLAGEMPAELLAGIVEQANEGDFVFPEDMDKDEPETRH